MKPNRKLINLVIAMTFLVVATTGILAFFLPFSIKIAGSHALMGFVFLATIGFHIHHNFKAFTQSFQKHFTLLAISFTTICAFLFLWQPLPIKKVLSFSRNIGPALDRFEMKDQGMVYEYAPAENYKLKLNLRVGSTFTKKDPPELAIWLENQSNYHIKTLFSSHSKQDLPYWSWKVEEYEKAKEEANNSKEEVDAISEATPNSSFDPKDYILPERNSEPFYMMIEVNQKMDGNEFYPDQPSLIYRVEIDNAYPKFYQVLDLLGYSKQEEEEVVAYFPDGKLTSCLKLIDSALLSIDR